MSDLNSFNCTGRLTRDPQARATPSGQSICNFTIAISEKYKDKERTTYLDCEAWGRVGEVIAEYQSKGDQVGLSGSLQLDQWDDKDGNKRSKIKLRVERMTMLQKAKSDSGGGQRLQPQRQSKPHDDFYSSDDSGFDDDTPF